MHSLRSKITIMTLCVTIVAVAIVSALSVFFIIKNEQREAEQMLLLMCETGEQNLDYYFKGVEDSIKKVSSFAEEDVESVNKGNLAGHVDRVRKVFGDIAGKTNGVLTYYYRIDPEYSEKVKGFWYTDLDGNGFTEHKVTDITKYDTKDTSKLVWFTVPKATGEPKWLPPYITDNLDARVISYNVPIYRKGVFVGVAGIEIDYSTMAKQVDSIKLYDNGYAFITDDKGELIFHPVIDVAKLTDKNKPKVPEGLVSGSTFVKYNYDGTDKKAAWLPLNNGMRIVVSAPQSEIDGDWDRLIREIILVSCIVLALLSIVAGWFAKGITMPLKKLTEAAKQVDQGNYDVEINYDGNDELGALTSTFKQLVSHVKEHITELSKRVFVDPLTSVRNKGAFSDYLDGLQGQIDDDTKETEFAICVFDCDNLKIVNDKYGHDKGDTYLKTASRLICRIFQHSPVFRIGGDEFAAVLQNEDYKTKDDLVESFEKEKSLINESTDNVWEQVHITMGMSVYDPEQDRAVTDTVRRADKEMYTRKRAKKMAKKSE